MARIRAGASTRGRLLGLLIERFTTEEATRLEVSRGRAQRSRVFRFYTDSLLRSRSPARSDIKRGKTSEYADLAALRRIQNQNSILGNQLTRAAVEEQ